MKTIMIFAGLIFSLLITGCSLNDIESSSTVANSFLVQERILEKPASSAESDINHLIKQTAWDYISEESKETIVGEWNEASVEKASYEQIPIIKSDKRSEHVYKVTFKTTHDALLGPICLYIDSDTNKVIGLNARK